MATIKMKKHIKTVESSWWEERSKILARAAKSTRATARPKKVSAKKASAAKKVKKAATKTAKKTAIKKAKKR